MVNLSKLLKLFNKLLIRINLLGGQRKNYSRGFFKNPLLYFGASAFFLLGATYASCGNPADMGMLTNSRAVFFNPFLNNTVKASSGALFSSQANEISLETPDLKIMQGNTLGGISAPYIVSGKVLGDVFGGDSSQSQKKEVVNYAIQPGDTLQSVANVYGISLNTLLWANDLTNSSTIKVGQNLAILPVDGVLHVVKSGDTVSAIAQTYKAKQDDIISFNGLLDQGDVYIGDILIIPGGVMTKKASSSSSANNQIPLANDYFIFPVQGQISQGLHYYNAVDIRNSCGTPIYAAAAGTVQRAVGNGGWNSGMGNHITILHSNGTVTYYGHLMTLLVNPGDKVYTGQKIALMGGAPGMAGAGNSTGCHLHFEVVGARNPLASYARGSNISYKQ
jgi:LysM repeat protein